jgi:hypothetical protein
MRFWKWWAHAPSLTDADRLKTLQAEEQLKVSKERGAAVHAEATQIVEHNHLAEKFHSAFNLKEK